MVVYRVRVCLQPLCVGPAFSCFILLVHYASCSYRFLYLALCAVSLVPRSPLPASPAPLGNPAVQALFCIVQLKKKEELTLWFQIDLTVLNTIISFNWNFFLMQDILMQIIMKVQDISLQIIIKIKDISLQIIIEIQDFSLQISKNSRRHFIRRNFFKIITALIKKVLLNTKNIPIISVNSTN